MSASKTFAISNAPLAAEPFQHDADLLLGGKEPTIARRMSLIASSADRFSGPDFCLIFAPCGVAAHARSSIAASRSASARSSKVSFRRKCWFDWTAAWKTASARLYKFGGNTLFRIHGTNERNMIGPAASPGCIGTLNSDVRAVML